MDVFKQRLEEEYDAQVISTMPIVPYQIKYTNGNIKEIKTPADFPENDELNKIETFLEPYVSGTLVFPQKFVGAMLELCEAHRGVQQSFTYMDETRIIMTYHFPLSEILTQFHDSMKSKSSGYASFEYEDIGYKPAELRKLDFLLNGKDVDALSVIAHSSKVEHMARVGARKLKEVRLFTFWRIIENIKQVIGRDLFEIVIQARANSKIIARESLKALKRDVTAKCYGGDVTRKMKLLDKQKAGKKRMKQVSGVKLPQDAFLVLMEKDDK